MHSWHIRSAWDVLPALLASLSLACNASAVRERSAHETGTEEQSSASWIQEDEFLARVNGELAQDEFAYHHESEPGGEEASTPGRGSTDRLTEEAAGQPSDEQSHRARRASVEQPLPQRASDPMVRFQLKADVSCGLPLPNPYGLLNSEDRDGSCRVCEHEPQSIPRCPKNKPAMELTHENLKLHEGKLVSFRGQFGYLSRMCTLKGGRCHCANTCGALLKLFASGTLRPPLTEEEAQRIRALPYAEVAPIYEAERQRLDAAPSIHVGLTNVSEESLRERPPNKWPYIDHGGSLHCGGDEGSLCCPYSFDRFEQWSDVIMTGVLSHEPEYPEAGWQDVYRFRMTSVCRE